VSREREVKGEGGYATIEGSAKSITGREMSTDAVAGPNVYGQPAVAGTGNTKYNAPLSVALTDVKVGERVLPIKTWPRRSSRRRACRNPSR
jgi:hypothetical protein